MWEDTGFPQPTHGRLLQATGSWDSSVRIWDLRAGTPEVSHQELEGHGSNISCLCYSASGLLVSWAALGRELVPQEWVLAVLGPSEHAVCAGIWLLGQDHSHLEAGDQQPACQAQGPHHLGQEHRLLP